MGVSRQVKQKLASFSPEEQDRLVRMGWEDRSTFEAIEKQFQISPNDFVKLMRQLLPQNAFKRWRKRIFEQGSLKNETQRGFKETRFRCSRQSVDGITKGWK